MYYFFPTSSGNNLHIINIVLDIPATSSPYTCPEDKGIRDRQIGKKFPYSPCFPKLQIKNVSFCFTELTLVLHHYVWKSTSCRYIKKIRKKLPSSYPPAHTEEQGSQKPRKLNVVIYYLFPLTIQCYKSSPPHSNTLYKYIMSLTQQHPTCIHLHYSLKINVCWKKFQEFIPWNTIRAALFKKSLKGTKPKIKAGSKRITESNH